MGLYWPKEVSKYRHFEISFGQNCFPPRLASARQAHSFVGVFGWKSKHIKKNLWGSRSWLSLAVLLDRPTVPAECSTEKRLFSSTSQCQNAPRQLTICPSLLTMRKSIMPPGK